MRGIIIPFFVAIFLAFFSTPLVMKLAFKIGAIDIPKDDRRIHKQPMPLIGGLAIYMGVIISSLMFCQWIKH